MSKHLGKRAVISQVLEGSARPFISERIVPAGGVRWEGFSHRQMWDMIMRSTPEDLFARADQWRNAATRLEEANVALQQRLNVLLATWQGPAAEAAAASQQRLLNWAQDAAVRASAVGTQLANYGNALVSARQRMPQPQHRWAEQDFREGEGANVLDGVAGAHLLLQVMSDRLPTAQQAREAKHEAVQIMRELEGNAADAERGMPRFDPAPKTTDDGAPRPDPWLWPAPDPRPNPVEPLWDGASVGTTTAQLAGDPGGYGVGEQRGSLPYGGGSTGGQPGIVGKGPAVAGAPLGSGGFGVGAGPLGVVGQGQGGRASGGFLPGAAGMRGNGDDDIEKPLADYLEPDEIFKDDRPVSPQVWGEWSRR